MKYIRLAKWLLIVSFPPLVNAQDVVSVTFGVTTTLESSGFC